MTKASPEDIKKAARLRARGHSIYMGTRGTLFDDQGVFNDIEPDADYKKFPCWLYQHGCDPILAKDSSEYDDARERGYQEAWASQIANRNLENWYWDIEDMSPRQLCVFAKEGYGVELPVDAGQETLMRAIFELAKSAPENRDRLVLMAHTIRFNLDETFEEIRRQSEGATEVERKEVYL